jgi:ubiquinol-cytochrome c reductase cytochrome c subunit
MVVKRPPQTVDAAGSLAQSGRTVNGTLVLGGADPAVAGAYVVSGTGTARKLRVAGASANGMRVVWRGRVQAGGLVGRIVVRGVHRRLGGSLRLARRSSTGDGASCDAVFTQNQAFFTGQVMDPVLVAICATCHVPGGQAQATRLIVVRTDPLATARSVAGLIDTATPAASLLVQKPVAAVPHGGGQQLMPGSAPEAALLQWATLIAQASCTTQGPGTPAADAFSRNCASCHGGDGAGTSTGPDVRCTVPSLLADAIRRGRGTAMPAIALSNADLRTIESYLAERCSGQPADVYAANCASCHGATAGGGRNADGVGGPNIRCSGEFFEAVRGGADRMPAYPSLTTNQITQLAAYVRGFCSLGGGGGGDD